MVNCFRDKQKYIYSNENTAVSKMVTQTEQHKRLFYKANRKTAIKKQNINCTSFNLAFSFNGSDNKQPNVHFVSEMHFMSFLSLFGYIFSSEHIYQLSAFRKESLCFGWQLSIYGLHTLVFSIFCSWVQRFISPASSQTVEAWSFFRGDLFQ